MPPVRMDEMTRWRVDNATDQVDAIDRALMQAVFDGVKRTSMPALVGLSDRKVRERLAGLKERVGARSWAAFGAAAHKRGWVRDVNSDSARHDVTARSAS